VSIDRLVDPIEVEEIEESPDSITIQTDLNLRPKTFAEYIGQKKLKQNLELAIKAAKSRGETIDHLLLYGPPGLGKTTMAGVVLKNSVPPCILPPVLLLSVVETLLVF
jgi:Holliday junction DNA helicase RuvB